MPRSETLLRRPHDRAAVARALRAAADFIDAHDDREHPILTVMLSGFDHSTTLEVEVRDHVLEDTGATITTRSMALPIAAALRQEVVT